MSGSMTRSAEWMYGGVWRIVVTCFRIPLRPPSLPVAMRDELRVFPPSPRYLAYMKITFWVALLLFDAAILIGWVALFRHHPAWAWLLALPAITFAVLSDLLAYMLIHLKYDTIWYALSANGVHLRRGILVISEHTISIANIQNVSISRGPLEQYFGIATLIIETAGASAAEDRHSSQVSNRVVMVGLDNAPQIRELLMSRVRLCRSSGLGDPPDQAHPPQWSEANLTLLREIRDELKQR